MKYNHHTVACFAGHRLGTTLATKRPRRITATNQTTVNQMMIIDQGFLHAALYLFGFISGAGTLYIGIKIGERI